MRLNGDLGESAKDIFSPASDAKEIELEELPLIAK